MDDDVSSGMIFVKQNLKVLREYYEEVTKNVKDALPIHFSGLPNSFGDGFSGIDTDLDVGQDMFESYSYSVVKMTLLGTVTSI